MSFVIRVMADPRAQTVCYDGDDFNPGEYVTDFDPDFASSGSPITGSIDTSPNPHLAIRFKTFNEAMAFYRTQSKARPLRPDGNPNRPMTALTVEIVRIE